MGATLESLSEEIINESVNFETCLFLLHMHKCTPIKSHIAGFTSIINELDKIEIKMEDGDQALLLLYFFTFFIQEL